jgi:hypothetical protein
LPFSDADNSLRDIVEAVAMIETFTAGMDFDGFREDPKTIAAVERKLQIISEAAVRMGAEAVRHLANRADGSAAAQDRRAPCAEPTLGRPGRTVSQLIGELPFTRLPALRSRIITPEAEKALPFVGAEPQSA